MHAQLQDLLLIHDMLHAQKVHTILMTAVKKVMGQVSMHPSIGWANVIILRNIRNIFYRSGQCEACKHRIGTYAFTAE